MKESLTPDQLRKWLCQRLAGPLPGRHAQRLAAPPLSYGRHHGPPLPATRQAAVLALLYPRSDGWYLPLILRAHESGIHRGQVAFPGGKLEAGETTCQAACRELDEELGVRLEPAQLAGALTPLYVFASNFLVTPWVAVVERPPCFRASPAEVAEVLELRLEDLPPPDCWTTGPVARRLVVGDVPQVAIGGQTLWGASAMILAELRTLWEAEPTAEGGWNRCVDGQPNG